MKKIVVLIPHYNAKDGLLKTLKSIKETSAIDVIIVDDGSREPLDIEALKSIYRQEGELFLLELGNNQGIEHALNAGLAWIHERAYDYIGRLDCGDTCIENKFAKQLDYMEKNPAILLLGTWANFIQEEEERFLYVFETKTTHKQITRAMYFNSCFVHPSVVFRKAVLDEVGYYPVDFKYAEDFAYFMQISLHGKVENYPEALLNYYIAENSISTLRRKEQIKSRIRIIRKYKPFNGLRVLSMIRNYMLLYTSRNLILNIKKVIRKK